jgi:membrane protease YdiL (CAAX protease family)
MIVLKIIEQLHHPIMETGIISFPVIIVFTIATFYIILKSGYPFSFYGITLKNWKRAIIESALITIGILILSIVIKYIMIEEFPFYANRKIFDGELWAKNFSVTAEMLVLCVYMIFVPLQELITRGLLQGSFQEFLTGKHKILLAIFLSNLLFSVTHLHLNLTFALSVFFTGLIWGWLYSRHQTLIGVVLSHLCIGVWALFILGV